MINIQETNFKFEGQIGFYRGKVRDVYIFEKYMVMIASDRISAFDVILPRPIPYKGQVLTQISVFFMQQTADLVPNWLQSSPDPNVMMGLRCEPLPVEMIIRGYLVGSAWRAYQKGQRDFNGNILPDNLHENDLLPYPIITPTTKAQLGQHDEDITSQEIIAQGLIDKNIYEQLEHYTQTLYQKGSEIAHQKGLILADTKYEFGLYEGKVHLIDEIHTPDSSRYFNIEGYQEHQDKQEPQPQRSKEMVRQWLIQNGFMGNQGEIMPEMTDEWLHIISNEYISLYEQLTGKTFEKYTPNNRLEMLQNNIVNAIT
jgi:phosphoribosylaminoimidazole-succinocarboxamide synthase